MPHSLDILLEVADKEIVDTTKREKILEAITQAYTLALEAAEEKIKKIRDYWQSVLDDKEQPTTDLVRETAEEKVRTFQDCLQALSSLKPNH